jgi:hypothetical protein
MEGFRRETGLVWFRRAVAITKDTRLDVVPKFVEASDFAVMAL